MARIQFYQRGHRPHYGRERWSRYERLRVDGFSAFEAEVLSAHFLGDPVVRRMISTRRNQVTRFSRVAEERGWSNRMAVYQFRRAVRRWYASEGYVTKGTIVKRRGKAVRIGGGQPSPYEWFRYIEKRLAARAGMSPEEYEKQRQSYETPVPRRATKGQIKAQKARAKIRKQAYQHHDIVAAGEEPKKVPLDRLEAWLKDARRLPKALGELGRIQREWRSSLRRRIKVAKTEQAAGRPAIG